MPTGDVASHYLKREDKLPIVLHAQGDQELPGHSADAYHPLWLQNSCAGCSSMARIAQIVATARYLPEHVVTNAELTARFTALGKPTVIDRLAASTGITQRFYVPDDWVTSDLASAAAKEALKRAGRKPQDVDLIILGATSPDYITPATSSGSAA
jgi:hypothetical protein